MEAFVGKTKVMASRWRAHSHFGEKARKATLRGFLFWCLGIALIVANWVWLQIFVLLYMKHATTPSRISGGVLIFNVRTFPPTCTPPPLCTLFPAPCVSG